jgi:hypothetical protein
LFQESKETKLVLIDEQQGSASATSSSGSTAHSMDVVFGIIWWIELHNPVNIGEVQTSLGNICAEKNTSFGLSEFEIGRCSLLLFLLSMDILDWNIHIV